MASSSKGHSAQARLFHYAGGDVDMLSDDDTRQSQEAKSKVLDSPISLNPGVSSKSVAALGPFAPPASYTPFVFSPRASQSAQKTDEFVLPTSGPTDASADLFETYQAAKKPVADSLPSLDSSARTAAHGTESADPAAHSSARTKSTKLSGSVDMMAKHEWNLRSLDAVIVSAGFLNNHINDLIWIKGRLLEHQGHILRCRAFAQQNLDAISRALYIDSKMGELSSSLSSDREEDEQE